MQNCIANYHSSTKHGFLIAIRHRYIMSSQWDNQLHCSTAGEVGLQYSKFTSPISSGA